MTTAVVYHTFAMPFSMQRGRPLKFVVYHRVVLGVKQEAQLMLTTGSTRLAVSRGQQTWYHSTCYI